MKESLQTKQTYKEKIELLKNIAKSKFIVLDDYYPAIYALPLSNKQKLIQVWHACGAFKKVGFSRVGKPGGPPRTSLTHRNYTDVTVSADDLRRNYAEAFGVNIKKVKALGVPRTDCFFDMKYLEKKKEELYERYPQTKNKKVVIFAPTFRGKGQKSAYYNFNLLDWEKIYKELNKEYIFIIKMHPFIKNFEDLNLPKNSGDFYLDFSDEREINNILMVSDILITDYSSVIFEYSLLSKPIVFFVPDLEEYIKNRDFYYPFSEYTFGPTVRSTSKLIKAIQDEYIDEEKIAQFKKRFMSACDGISTKRIVNEMILKNND
jgi:CDP-ribitol ribitolphosphotransferase